MTTNLHVLVETMRQQALILPALAQALSYDLAVAPVLLTDGSVETVVATADGFASMLGGRLLDLAGASSHEITGGDHDAAIPSDMPLVVVLQDADTGMITALLEKVQDLSIAPVVVVLNQPANCEAAALEAIGTGCGVHPAHVPTARLSPDPLVVQPLVVTGMVEFTSAGAGRRDFAVYLDPHGAELRFSVHAEDGMDDDALNDAVEGLALKRGVYALRLEDTAEGIVCRLGDWELIED